MIKPYCDLHTHSNFSDGTYTPAELIDEAVRLGLSAIALTDHNCISGLAEFKSAAEGKPINAVPGVEFSTDYGETELHIVALFIKEESYEKINALVDDLKKRKEKCNLELIERLNAGGYIIDLEKLHGESRGQINRAHIAHQLMMAGYVKSIEEAFDTLLSKNGKFYTQPKRLDVFEVIKFIKSIGAVSVLAHPFLNLSEPELREFLPKAKAAGLHAMETLYSKFDDETTALARKIASEYGIFESGGSDFHGWRKPGIELGTGRGTCSWKKHSSPVF